MHGRIFRVGTIIILLVVAGAIVIPVLHKSSTSAEKVAVVGGDRASLERLVRAEAIRVGTTVDFVPEASVSAAQRDLRSGTLDLAVVDGDRIVVGTGDRPDRWVRYVQPRRRGLCGARGRAVLRAAGLTATQIQQLNSTKPVPVQSLEPAAKTHTVNGASVIGVILVFVMLTQYTTWILMGVMQEKASRVVEVLLATMRPIQLLSGKVLGIGLVAMGQAATVLVFALVLGEAVGSNVLHGAEPVALAAALVWLLLGYAFYCWVYAAAGSMAERQDQVQTLALPLSLPIIVGYVIALTAAASGSASTFVKVLAYFPPTAPFAMPVLVGLGQVQWWGFAVSVLVTLAATVVVARIASGIYLRAVLRTGASVPLRELIRGSASPGSAQHGEPPARRFRMVLREARPDEPHRLRPSSAHLPGQRRGARGPRRRRSAVPW